MLAFFLATLAAAGSAPTASASIDHLQAHVGDRLLITLTAIGKAGVSFSLPPVRNLALGKFELVEEKTGDRNGEDLGAGRRAYRFFLTVTAYEIGEFEIPPIELSYLDSRAPSEPAHQVKTLPLSVRISPLIPESEAEPHLLPLKPPRSSLIADERVLRALHYALIALGTTMVGWLCWVFFRRFKRTQKKIEIVVPARPPEEVAFDRLHAIRRLGNFSVDGYRPFSFAVAEVVRAYLGARYNFDSLELTTTELLDEVARRAPTWAAADGPVANFLNTTDLIKFASFGSSNHQAESLLSNAEQIVVETTEEAKRATAPTSAAVTPPIALLPTTATETSAKQDPPSG